jgi:hypothetical protein
MAARNTREDHVASMHVRAIRDRRNCGRQGFNCLKDSVQDALDY